MEGKKKPHMTPAQKLWLAVKIQENKVLLFEKFNPKLTLEDKTAKWMEIFEERKAQGLPFTMTCGSDCYSNGYAICRDNPAPNAAQYNDGTDNRDQTGPGRAGFWKTRAGLTNPETI